MDRLIAPRAAALAHGPARAAPRAASALAGLVLLVPVLRPLSPSSRRRRVFFGVRSAGRARPRACCCPVALARSPPPIGLFWVLSPVLTGRRPRRDPRPLAAPASSRSRLRRLVASSLLANLAQPLVLAKMPVVVGLALGLAGPPATLPFTLAGRGAQLRLHPGGGAAVVGLLLHGPGAQPALPGPRAVPRPRARLRAQPRAPGPAARRGRARCAVLERLLLDHDLFALSPFAWGVRAAVHAGRGELAPSSLYAAAAARRDRGGARPLRRHHRAHLSRRAGPRPSRRPRRAAAARACASPGALGALVEKDLRVAWRDPALKATPVHGPAGPAPVPVLHDAGRGRPRAHRRARPRDRSSGSPSFGTNAFGLERRGIGLLMSFPFARWRILVAKNLASDPLRLPAVLTVLVASAVIAPPASLPAAAHHRRRRPAHRPRASTTTCRSCSRWPRPSPGRTRTADRRAAAAWARCVISARCSSPWPCSPRCPSCFLAWLPRAARRCRWLWLVTLPLALAGAAAVYAMLVAGAEQLLRGASRRSWSGSCGRRREEARGRDRGPRADRRIAGPRADRGRVSRDRRRPPARLAPGRWPRGAIAVAARSVPLAVADADIVVLAASPRTNRRLLPQAGARGAARSYVVTDVGSVKRRICADARRRGPRAVRGRPSHGGPRGARASRPRRRTCSRAGGGS